MSDEVAPALPTPIELRWTVPAELAGLARVLPYKVRLLERGERGVVVSLTLLPADTLNLVPANSCCHSHNDHPLQTWA